jgi:hypothetical protein
VEGRRLLTPPLPLPYDGRGVPCGLGEPFSSGDEEGALQGGFVSLGKAKPSQDNYLVQRYGCFERKVVSLTTLKILAFGNKN